MILSLMLLLLILPICFIAESLVWTKKRPVLASVFAGISLGMFLWNGYSYWRAFPAVSILMGALGAITVMVFLIRVKGSHLGSLVLASVLSIAMGFTLWQGLLVNAVNHGNPSVMTSVSAEEPQGNAVIIYHRGKGSFQSLLMERTMEELHGRSWKVESHNLGEGVPMDLSDYDLVVLSTPTYDWRPSRIMREYLANAAGLEGKPVIAITTGAGWTVTSQAEFEEIILEQGANLRLSLSLYTAAPNHWEGNSMTAEEVMSKHLAELEF